MAICLGWPGGEDWTKMLKSKLWLLEWAMNEGWSGICKVTQTLYCPFGLVVESIFVLCVCFQLLESVLDN